MNDTCAREYDIDILLTIDTNFILGSGALICSIKSNNPGMSIIYHVVTSKNDKGFVEEHLVGRLSRLYGIEIKTYCFEDIPLYNRLNCGVLSMRKVVQCIRLIAPAYIEIKSGKLLYLDSDIVCVGDISELTEIKFGDSIFAATRWREDGAVEVLDKKFKLVGSICSGVVLFNVEKWMSERIENKLIDFVISEKPEYVDQTALNVICYGNIYFLERKFDSINSRDENTVFIHYASRKPWEPWNFSLGRNLIGPFRKYAKEFEPDVSGWISFRHNKFSLVNLNSEQNPEARYATKWISRKMFKRGFFWCAFYFMIMHLYYKIKKKGIIGLILMRSNSN